MSNFMHPEIVQKGNLYSCDCQHCGATNYWHERISDGPSDEFHESACCECGRRIAESSDDSQFVGRQYAGRYSAPGYLDCTEWNYSANRRELEKTLKEMYGE